jgi:hypothetical protein
VLDRYSVVDDDSNVAMTTSGTTVTLTGNVRTWAEHATLRWRLVRVPGRLVRHARGLTLRLPPGQHLLAEILARLRALP